jgi:hypothetical protein
MRSRRNLNPRKEVAKSRIPPTETAGEFLSDGSMIDLICGDLGALELVLTDGDKIISVSSQIELDRTTFVPAVFGTDLLKAIRFPPKPQDYGTTPKLFDDLHSLFGVHPGLQSDSVSALAHYSLVTWFPDCMPAVPCLSIVAPDTSGRDLLFRLLSRTCRRPLHLLEPTRPEILASPLSLRPTLIIDQAKPTSDVQRLLRVMSQAVGFVPRSGQLKQICCPTIIVSAEPLGDPLLLTRALQINLMPGHAAVSKVNQILDSELAQALPAKLLQYQLLNFAKVRASEFDAHGCLGDLTTALAACIVDDDELQARVNQMLEPQERDSRARNSTSSISVVIEAGLALSHDRKRESAYVGEFADAANGILHGRGETVLLEPRAVGDILRSLGLSTQRLGAAGRGVLLVRETRRKIHLLARSYDVPSIQGNFGGCEFCTEVREG